VVVGGERGHVVDLFARQHGHRAVNVGERPRQAQPGDHSLTCETRLGLVGCFGFVDRHGWRRSSFFRG
jgi:hypothetical protein